MNTHTTMKDTPRPPQCITERIDCRNLSQHLSPHFTLREMTLSAAAIEKGLDNTPDALAVVNLRLLCQNVLEPLRRRFGKIRVTSGFRSVAVNSAVGGAEMSQHRFGQAADLHVGSRETGRKMFDFLRFETPFDQLIYEYRPRDGAEWIHVSYNAEGNRRSVSTHYRLW